MGWFSDAFTFLCKGGPIMIPLMACSVASVAVLIDRFLVIKKKARQDTSNLVTQVENLVLNGETKRAVSVCESFDSPVASVMAAGLKAAHLGVKGAERAMEEQGTKVVSFLQKRLGVLDTVITIAPLLGLLGTVTGMISAFHVISSKEGMGAPTAITGGVAEALIATATGLAIAIVTLIGYNYLTEQVRLVTEEIDVRANQLLNCIEDAREVRREVTKLSA